MNVVYTFDDGYTDITLVSIISLLENNTEVDNINIYIIDCGISERNIKRISNTVKKYNRKININKAIDVEKKIPICLDKGQWSLACYVRLFFAEMLPDVDRVMHIDCDTIVRGKLEDVYKESFDGNVCMACYDCVPSTKYLIGFKEQDAYYSNGFLIFNLDAIRKNKIEELFIDYIVENKGVLPHLDQDVLSTVLKGKIKLLPPEYNMMSPTLAINDKASELFMQSEPYYTQNEIDEAVRNPLVIHFVGYRYSGRPWTQPCYHSYNSEWISYFKMVEGRDDSLLKRKRKKYGILHNIVCKIWNIGSKVKAIDIIEKKMEKRRYRKKCKIMR